MKKIYHTHVLVLSLLFYVLTSGNLFAISYTWNGSVSEEWSNSSNWSPAGVPDISDDVIIDATGSFDPLWEELPGVRNFTLNGGIFDLEGFFMPIYGNCNFNGGTITNGTLVLTGSNTIFAGTEFFCNINASGPTIEFDGSEFHGNVSATKVGGSNVSSIGGNTFHGDVTITNEDNSQYRFQASFPDIFEGNVILNNTSSGGIFLAHSSLNSQFLGDLELNSSGSGGIRFGQSGGTCTISIDSEMSIGGSGFSNGQLRFAGVTQLGNSTANLIGSSGAQIYFEPLSTFNSRLNIDFPRFYFNGSTFNDSVRVVNTINQSSTSNGGNTFNGVFTLIKESNGWLRMGDVDPDIFNNDVYLQDMSGNSGIEIARSSAGNEFNGDIYLSGANSGAINICSNGGTATLSSGNTIALWDVGFNGGSINIANLTQLGSGLINFVQATGNGLLILNPGCEFNAEIDISFPSFSLNGATFNGDARFVKTVSSTRYSNGGNIFNGNLTIENQENGSIYMANINPDVYNNQVVLINNTNGYIYMSHNAGLSIYNDAVFVNSTGTSRGIYFGNGGGSSLFNSGSSIQIGSDGFTTGELRLVQVDYDDTELLQLSALSGNGLITINSSTFEPDINFVFPQLNIISSVFNGRFTGTKTSTGNNTWSGGNTFNAPIAFTVESAQVILGSSIDIFNDSATFISSGSGRIYLAHNAEGTEFNRELILCAQDPSSLIAFGYGGGTASLSSGNKIAFPSSSICNGSIRFRNLTQLGSGQINLLSESNTSSFYFETGTIFNAPLNISAGGIYLNGSTFNSEVTMLNNNTNVTSTGGNIFNSDFAFTNNSAGSYTMAGTNPDTYLADVTLISDGNNARINIANASAGNLFSGDIYLNSINGAAGIRICDNANGNATLQSGFSLKIGSDGFDSGDLYISRLVQSGSASNDLVMTGSSRIYFQTGNEFGGPVTADASQIALNGSTFQNVSSFTQTGTSTNTCSGGNTFNDTAYLIDSGAGGTWTLANVSADVFNAPLYVSSLNGGRIRLAYNTHGNQFKNLFLSSKNGAGGIDICSASTNSSASIDGGLFSTAVDFNSGDLNIYSLTQTGSTESTLLTSGAARALIQQGNTFTGKLTIQAETISFRNSIFNDVCRFTQTGFSNTTCYGGNTFADSTYIIDSSTGGNWYIGNNQSDDFQGPLSVSTSNGGNIYLAHNSPGNSFTDLILSCTAGGQGIRICQGTLGSASFDGSIKLGAAGFSSGDLEIRNLTQTSANDIELLLPHVDGNIYFETGTTFLGNLTATAGRVYLNGTTFGNATIEQTGSLNIICLGGNTFNGNCDFTLSGSGYWLFGNSNPDIFNGDVTVHNIGSSIFYLGHRAAGTVFNGDLILNSTGTATGIYFGQNNGTSTLNSGGKLKFGSEGFTSGTFRIRNFVQTGADSVLLNSNTANLNAYFETGNEFRGYTSIKFANLYLNGSSYYGKTLIERTGTATLACNGGNWFYDDATLHLSGSGQWRLANSSSDYYYSDVTFLQDNPNTLYPAYNRTVQLRGNYSSLGSAYPIITSANNNAGWIQFAGSAEQQIITNPAQAVSIVNLEMNKTGGSLTLNENTTITRNLTLTSGVIQSSASALLILNDNAVSSGGSSAAYVSGPLRKIGNDAFTFPTGKGGIYRPISISAPSNTTHHFTAELFLGSADGTYSHSSKDASIETLSQCEYWILDRTNGTSNVQVGLSYNGVSCLVTNQATLIVSRWNGSSWTNHGNGGTSGSAASGTIVSSGAITSFSPFTLGSTSPENPLPVELITFNAKAKEDVVDINWSTASETNNHYFEVEKSKDLINFVSVGKVTGKGNTTQTSDYSLTDEMPYEGTSYYRLVQYDFNGDSETFDPVAVNFENKAELGIQLWPNPAKDIINIQLSNFKDELINLTVIDEMGRIIETLSPEFNDASISQIQLNNYKAGVYTIMAYSKSHQAKKRFIKH